jgi:exodeoxyribonuclease V gamma subunit
MIGFAARNQGAAVENALGAPNAGKRPSPLPAELSDSFCPRGCDMVPAVNARTGLHLHTSNRLEESVAELAGIIARPAVSIFEPEIVVVQSVGMGRWLSLRLAEAHGICANVRFPFPQKLVSEIFALALPDAPSGRAFERDVLSWRIMRILPGLSERREFAPVRRYLEGDREAMKRYQLAHKIAEVFDRYLVFRPELILRWDAGKDSDDWQAILWRELAKENPKSHPPALAQRLKGELQKQRAQLPARFSVFGLSSLPRLYLDILQTLATHLEIHLFLLEPTDQWWSDIVSAKKEAKIRRRQPGLTTAELNLDRGNTLLASMGTLGQDFLGLVWELDPATEHERFVPPNEKTILERVQHDIFLLQNRSGTKRILPNDGSIQFHSCHGPMREMEVLHDQLLAAFAADSSLEPRDVIVMMPDIASYAPYIQAVFDTPESDKVRIPFTIADRAPRGENNLVDTFLAILELSESRYGASSVLHLLESSAILRRFELTEADLETIRAWIDKAAIRWGIDPSHREQFGLPAFTQNTWREGLDRLLLGYAMPVAGDKLYHGILPIDDVEGSYAEVLGNFLDFTESIFWIARELTRPRSLAEWKLVLGQVVERFFATDEFVRELYPVREVLDSLGEISREIAFTETLPFEVILAHLKHSLNERESGAGFLVGRVTFCALKPMRSIPFKVICLVGMNGTAYPRKSANIGFDLIAQHPRPGDRSIRDDDRYLFLEALLSARKIFYLSYVGQSIKDGSSLPPSVLVSELLDYLAPEDVGSLVTRHRLQPFNPEYFRSGSALFSYSANNCLASATATGQRVAPPRFFTKTIAPPKEEWRLVTLENLFSLFRNPSKFFLRERLGIRLPNERSPLEEREPFEVHGLAAYKIQEELVRRILEGEKLDQLELLIRASGQFPAGQTGCLHFRKLSEKVAEFAGTVRPHLGSASLQSQPVEVELGDWKLTGRIDGLTDNGLLAFRLTKAKPLDLIRTWVLHLALNLTRPAKSRLITEGELRTYEPIEEKECRHHLHELLEVYGQGLLEPLPFFPRSSRAFAEQTVRPDGKRDPLTKAAGIWEGTGWEEDFAEKDDSYMALAFRHCPEPLDARWGDLALRVFRPLLLNSEAVET